jgi:hypothetical protein
MCMISYFYVSTNFNARQMNNLCGGLIDITIFNTICKINFCLRIDIKRKIIFHSYETNVIQRKSKLSTSLIFFGWLNGIFSHSRNFWKYQLIQKTWAWRTRLDTLQAFNLGLFFFLIQYINIGGTMILLMAKKQATIIISQPSIFYFLISRWNATRMKKNTILITSCAQPTSIHCVVDTKKCYCQNTRGNCNQIE